MPIPKPKAGESQSDFVSRCAGDATMNADYKDSKQRVAVCESAWRKEHGSTKPETKSTVTAAAAALGEVTIAEFEHDLARDTVELFARSLAFSEFGSGTLVEMRADSEGDKPYGDVPYADPGYQSDGKKRYPIDTKERVKAAWSYINKAKNREAYTSAQLSKIEGRIKAAAKKFGVEIADTSSAKSSAGPRRERWGSERAFLAGFAGEIRATADANGTALPDGVCGRVVGVALTYNVVDEYGTTFLPGCLAKTRAERVAAGKVQLFADHGPFTDTHVGVVRDVADIGDGAVMTADLFDTEAGRAMKEYLGAVLASGASTGLSVGFRPIDKRWVPDDDGDMRCEYAQIELREISFTPVNAVPGTEVTAVRREPGDVSVDDVVSPAPGSIAAPVDLLKRTLRAIVQALPEREARAIVEDALSAAARTANELTDTTAATASTGTADSTAGTASDAAAAASSATGAGAESTERNAAAAAAASSAVATPSDRARAIRDAMAHRKAVQLVT